MDAEDVYAENTWTYLSMCTEPTVYEGLKFAKDILFSNLLLRFTIQFLPLPHNVRHSLSLITGVYLLYNNIGSAIFWTIGLTTGSYTMITVLSWTKSKRRSLFVSFTIITFLLLCEIYVLNPKMWQQIRGIQMIAAMKVISVAIELDRNIYNNILNPVEYGGYIFCPANCILGPWMSFQSYNKSLEVRFLCKRWFSIILINLILSISFLVLSNCLIPWYIDDDMPKWLIAYRDAQAFRMSHYFVSSMSVLSMVSAGFGLTNDCHCELKVTRPSYIEIPRSLVQVVVYWNIPMHQWLKMYVFKTFQPYGQFTAILITYAVSSLLHGLNFQLSAVLLSIGTFSYVEYNLRSKIALALEVCCLANPCLKQCTHKYKKNSLLALVVNSIFTLITIMHLAYLGVMFEASFSVQESGFSYLHTMSKWENLNYFSHGLVVFMYIIYLMM